MALQDREAALKCIKSSFVRTTKSDRFRMFTFPPLPQDAWTSVEKFETLTCQGRKIYKSLINSCLSDPIFDEDKTLLLEGFNCPILLKRFVKETDSLDLASCPFTGLNASESLFVYLGRYSTCEFAWIRLKGCFISIVPSMTKYALKRLQAKRRKDLSVSNPPRTSKVQSREWRKCSKNITSAERRNITTLGDATNSNPGTISMPSPGCSIPVPKSNSQVTFSCSPEEIILSPRKLDARARRRKWADKFLKERKERDAIDSLATSSATTPLANTTCTDFLTVLPSREDGTTSTTTTTANGGNLQSTLNIALDTLPNSNDI